MRITNNTNISQSLYDAIVQVNRKYSKGVADYSATELISPARIRALRIKHYKELSEDVTELLWRFMGHLVHGAIANMDNSNVLAEERMFANVNGTVISGCPDRFDGISMIDYKFTSKYAVKDGVKPEWEAQLNIYDYIYFLNEFYTTDLWIEAILKDAVRDEPKIVKLQVPLWVRAKSKGYIEKRIKIHQDAEKELPLCTEEERWASPEKWALMKKGNKKAIKLYDTKDEAENRITMSEDPKIKYYIEHRPAISKRCKDYCIVSSFCDQYRKEKENGIDTP